MSAWDHPDADPLGDMQAALRASRESQLVVSPLPRVVLTDQERELLRSFGIDPDTS